MTETRVTQHGLEILQEPAPEVRVTQHGLEVLQTVADPAVRVSQVFFEYLSAEPHPPEAIRVTQTWVEYLSSEPHPAGSTGTRRPMVVIFSG